jgi:hypothetical protein
MCHSGDEILQKGLGTQDIQFDANLSAMQQQSSSGGSNIASNF